MVLPGRHVLNLGIIVAFFVMTVIYVLLPHEQVFVRQLLLGIMTVLALFLGWHLVASIGGGDMPVCLLYTSRCV